MSDKKEVKEENGKDKKGSCCDKKSVCLGIGTLLASIAALCAFCCCGGGKGDGKSDAKACC